jgi:hypothetical protein
MCTALFCTDGLMKPHSLIRVARKWHGLCIDLVLMCLGNPEGLNNGYLPSGHGPRFHEIPNSLSGALITI